MKKIYHPCYNCKGHGAVYVNDRGRVLNITNMLYRHDKERKCASCDGTGAASAILGIIEDWSIMKIRRLNHRVVFDDNGVDIALTGYAFIDEHGKCTIIVYGEKKMKLLKEYFDS